MEFNKIRLVFTFLILVSFSNLSFAEGWYIGGGLQTVSFGKDATLIGNGMGADFNVGYNINDMFALDIMLSSSSHDEANNIDLSLLSWLIGGKIIFGNEKFQPYLIAGISQHTLEESFLENWLWSDDFETISGSGTYMGAGASIFMAKRHAINISFLRSSWDGKNSSNNYDITTDMVSIAYNYHFSR